MAAPRCPIFRRPAASSLLHTGILLVVYSATLATSQMLVFGMLAAPLLYPSLPDPPPAAAGR